VHYWSMKIRINKFLAERGVASRRKVDSLIEQGLILVNGELAENGMQVDENDAILVNGEAVNMRKPKSIYIALNKPVGLITSVDPLTRDNVIDHIGLNTRIFPIGRLDVASQGLLLLTNDGELSERVTHPRYYHEKEYIVRVDREISDDDLEVMRNGMMILGSLTKSAKVVRLDLDCFRITLTEGRNRQIRRMCEQLGYRVKMLQRIRVMNIELGDMALGEWRFLEEGEISELKKSLGLI
jgi:23S rRNA pseudouridine2604 synthase